MNAERFARLMVIVLALGLPLAAVIVRATNADHTIEMHGMIAETGGWTPANLAAKVGEPIRLHLTSDDVIHGFAIGQSDAPAIDVKPGEFVETTLTFERPGKYTFFCTRWCGPNHWRMRGTIEVTGPGTPAMQDKPMYIALGLDIDASHPASAIPVERPSAARGASLGVRLPASVRALDYVRTHSPVDAWQSLRADPISHNLTDAQVWDLVALAWRSSTTQQALDEGRRLYTANCAACHGESGAGDGVMAASLSKSGHDAKAPAKFADPASMLGASPALLQGKIVRGGMGTGMPYWGPIFTEAQTWALVDYLWTFQMEDEP